MSKRPKTPKPERVLVRIEEHFKDYPVHELNTVQKVFPTTVRPDLEAAIEDLLSGGTYAFAGISKGYDYQTLSFSFLTTERREPAVIAAPEYMDIDIGDAEPGRCISAGIWFFHVTDGPVALLVSQQSEHMGDPGVRVEAIASPAAGGREEAQAILAALAEKLTSTSVYRGKALSFATSRSYRGGLGALTVHRLPNITLDQIILPKKVLATLERTVFGFVDVRDALREHGFSSKRGILLYGPPGTGKTHFIRYLLSKLKGHTSLLVTAEQVGALDQIMTIARALQPAVVVIEDADLLAGTRNQADPCGQVLLNKLLNHMDGLTEDAEILFILTTNRPETLEPAVRDRPGRIDQAIEIPKPDAECRARLLELYRGDIEIPADIAAECVRRTEDASAAFIRELARRMAQFVLLRNETAVTEMDMRRALEEMLGAGDFTAIALGAEGLDA